MISAVFVDRPRLAMVLSILMTLAGILAYQRIALSQFPDIVPPQVTVSTSFPGASAAVVEATVAQPLEASIVGVDRIRAFHLNDSKKPLASRVDRHDHIGEGCLGLEPFRNLLNDPRFADRPMYLETKKEERDGEEMDAVNLRTLLSLIR